MACAHEGGDRREVGRAAVWFVVVCSLAGTVPMAFVLLLPCVDAFFMGALAGCSVGSAIMVVRLAVARRRRAANCPSALKFAMVAAVTGVASCVLLRPVRMQQALARSVREFGAPSKAEVIVPATRGRPGLRYSVAPGPVAEALRNATGFRFDHDRPLADGILWEGNLGLESTSGESLCLYFLIPERTVSGALIGQGEHLPGRLFAPGLGRLIREGFSQMHGPDPEDRMHAATRGPRTPLEAKSNRQAIALIPDDLREHLRSGAGECIDLSETADGVLQVRRIRLCRLEELRLRTYELNSDEYWLNYGEFADQDEDPGLLYRFRGIDVVQHDLDGDYGASGLLTWFPDLKCYGSWDCDHHVILTYPRATWPKVLKRLGKYVNGQWRPETVKHRYLTPWRRQGFPVDMTKFLVSPGRSDD